jgi:polygalacturonase
MNPLTRRQLLGTTGLAVLAGATARLPVSAADVARSPGPHIFDVRNFGAVGDGVALDNAAINRAVDAAEAAGGGMVYVPPGTYLCGTVILKSNVTLYLEAGATLLGSKGVSHYTPQPYRDTPTGPNVFGHDTQDTGPRHLIFARDAENVTVAGPGRIDGQGHSFWVPSHRKTPPPEEAWQDVATFDWKALPGRPSPMLEFYRCKNLRLEDIRIENAAGWTLRPIECENVFIHGISIKNPVFGINTDGLDITACKNVFISDCLIDTGDDAICLKSESPYGGEVKPTKNITITNCVLTCCCNGLKFGTATFGSFENITFSNSTIFNESVDLNARVISGVALEIVDGGALEGVLISNIRMQRVRTPIFIRRGLRHADAHGQPGIVRGVMIENIQATESLLTSSITGLAGFDVEDVTLSNLQIESVEAGPAEWANRHIPDVTKAYPEARMFGRLPAYGLYCRHVKGLRLRQLEFKAAPAEARPAIFGDDVKDLEIAGLRGAAIVGDQPVIRLHQTKKVFLNGCVAPDGAATFLEVQGDQTERVTVLNNDFRGITEPVKIAPEVPAKAVSVAGNASG